MYHVYILHILSVKVPDAVCVVGFGKCPEGGALRLFGASDSGADEEHSTV